MGRFARSNDTSRAKAQFVERRPASNMWASRANRTAKPQPRIRSEQKIFRIAAMIALLIVGTFSGWKAGKYFFGPSQNYPAQTAAMGTPLQIKDADSMSNQVAQAGTEEATSDSSDSDDSDAFSPEASSVQNKSGSARRYSKGRGFEPTSIVTKPVKVISKPIKKLNPLKLF